MASKKRPSQFLNILELDIHRITRWKTSRTSLTRYTHRSMESTKCISSTRCTCFPMQFNAFLKTLEETTFLRHFILAATEKHKVIPTILSRCQIFPIQISDISRQLKKIATAKKSRPKKRCPAPKSHKKRMVLCATPFHFRPDGHLLSGRCHLQECDRQPVHSWDYEVTSKSLMDRLPKIQTTPCCCSMRFCAKGFDGQILSLARASTCET